MQILYNPTVITDKMEDIEALKRAIKWWNDKHYDVDNAGDYSATSLINPPRITQLVKRHRDDLELPLASQINAFFGTAVHDMYEKALQDDPDYELEQRLSMTIADRLITGKFDILYKKDKLQDIKTTKTWKKVFDPQLKEWHEQQNIYAVLLRINGIRIKSLNIIAHYYDWVNNMALRDRDYPQQSVVEYSLSLWDDETANSYLASRVELHKACEDIDDEQLPECSREDRWERLPNGQQMQYAVFRDSQSKRASKVCDSYEEALTYGRSAKGHGTESFIEVRYAQRKRCELYCSVAKHCNHYQEYLYKVQNGKLNDYIPLYS